jgi:hypothetical protein
VNGLAALVLITSLLYVGVCVFYPLAACGRCKGSGRLSPQWDRGHARVCPRCKGTPWRPRMAARVVRTLFAHRSRR